MNDPLLMTCLVTVTAKTTAGNVLAWCRRTAARLAAWAPCIHDPGCIPLTWVPVTAQVVERKPTPDRPPWDIETRAHRVMKP